MKIRAWSRIDGSYPLFVALWASALFVHQTLRLAFRDFQPVDAAAAALFLLAAFVPRAPLALPAIAIVQLVSLWIDLPQAGNHWVLSGFINLSIIATVAAMRWRSRHGQAPAEDDILAALGPLVRPQIILVYLLAAFHKLNADFLDPNVGCLGWVARWTAARSGIDSIAEFPGLVTVAAYGAVIVEAAIPLLLVRRRTWFYGVVLGVLFHLASLETGFTVVGIVLYFFFFPWRSPQTIAQGFDLFLRERSGGLLTLARVIRAYVLFFLLVIPSTRVEAWLSDSVVAPWIPPVRSVIWIALLMLLCAALLRYFLAIDIRRVAFQRERIASRALYVIPALLVLNGLGPYLGFKTTTAFDMFSNLRVLGEQSNHLLLRHQPLRISHRTRDLVAVKAANDQSLVWIGRQGPFPYVQFKREIQSRVPQRRVPLAVLYERNGQQHRVLNVAEDPQLMASESVFARKLLPLRREPWKGTSSCPW